MTILASPIADTEKERRAKNVKSIRHSQIMEGGDISPYAVTLFDKYIEGDISSVELTKQLIAHYQIN